MNTINEFKYDRVLNWFSFLEFMTISFRSMTPPGAAKVNVQAYPPLTSKAAD
jgi:hypothetical protein